MDVKSSLLARTRELGFALCRVARCEPPAHAAEFGRWLDAGMAGEMSPWLERGRSKRADPQTVLPGARSVVVLAMNYWQGPRTPAQAHESAGRIARYAWGDDYHDLIEARLRSLDEFLQACGGRQRYYVDTGPVLERDFAAEAGAGWQGKSTMLLHPELGTWYFLAELLTTLEIEPDAPVRHRCGTCTRCLDACPTGAIRHDQPYRLDARLCISYLTIEHKGPIPLELRPQMGGRIYGCDDCLDACPWNRFAQESREATFQARPATAGVPLRDFLSMSDEDFRAAFKGSPIKRTKRRGLLRNVCVALGNVGTAADLPALERAAAQEEELVAEHARWAIGRIRERTGAVAQPGMKNRVAVIGAGVGGLTCAALLAKAGLAVTVFERNERVGGKLNWLEAGGYTWDTGPSLLTMPYVFERLWEKLGRRLEDDLTLVPLPVTCRYRWTDGTVIDEDAAFWERPEVASFLRYARGLYDLSADAFLHHPLDEWWRQLRWRNLSKLRHLPKIASFRTMDGVVRRFFGDDPHLVQLFNRFATYNGSSPYATPAAFNIIPYVEAKFGGWYVKGGLYGIARALENICRELGVRILTGCEVQALGGIDGYHLQTNLERTGPFDTIVCNQDVLTAYPRLLSEHPASASFRQTHLERLTPSISAFLLYLGVGRTYRQLSHHNIFFSDDYPREFRQLFDERQPPDEPTIYVAVHSKDDPDRAPAGCENWFVLVNAPALTADRRVDWASMAQEYGDAIIARLETRFGFGGLREAIRVRRQFTPADFETRYLANAGSLYGFASHGVRAAFQRPKLQPDGMRDFYFVGGSTHPGGGLPLVCLSGQMVADKILRRKRSKHN